MRTLIVVCLLLAGCSGLQNGNGLIGNKAVKGPICTQQINEVVTRVYSC